MNEYNYDTGSEVEGMTVEGMYPEVYNKMAPHIQGIVDEMSSFDPSMFQSMGDAFEMMADELLRRSGLDTESDMMDQEAVPAVTFFGGRGRSRGGFGRNRGRNPVRNIALFLLLNELFNRNRPYGHSYSQFPYGQMYNPYF